MDCQQAQNDLLSAESLTLLAPELSAHLAECPQCQALLAKLRHLETETRALPVPAGHEQPSPEFLRRIAALRTRSGAPVRRFVRQAIAAGVVLVIGLVAVSLIFFNGSTVQADVLLGQLVDWNLAIAHTHDPAARKNVYQQQLNQLQKQANQSHLAAADRALALALLNNAQWMTTETNVADESQRFQALANQLLARQQAASDGAATHLQQIYRELINEGASSGAGANVSPSTTQHNSNSTSIGPSSALPANRNLVTPEIRTSVAGAAPVEPDGIAMVVPRRADLFSGSAFSGDGAAPSPSRSSGAADGGSLRAGPGRTHHAGSHGGGGESLGTSGEISHSGPTPAPASTTAASAPQPARSNNDSSTHSLSNSSPSAPSQPTDDASAPPSWPSGMSHNPAFTSAGWHGGLADAAGLLPPGRWHLMPAFDLDGTISAEQAIRTPMMPSMPTGIPMSRREIESILAHHINSEGLEASDLMLPYPPPMGEEGRMFFHLDDPGRPIPFPEPSVGLAVFLGGLALRIRKRDLKKH